MDDDVQYLGTRLAAPEHIDVDNPVTGVTLHVDKCGDKPAHNVSFYRLRSSYVNIGRKSGSDDRSMRRENDDHNVVFTCQVVSARHAKLVLSESGQVYIVDLHSRHGTHLARCGEPAPRMLQPEIETLLTDGDVLTFGKVVGAGSYHVSPVTVRVELLTGSPPCDPIADRATISSHPASPVLDFRPRRLSSGRYGLISACIIESDSPQSSSSLSVSSDAASSQSEQESDGEEEHDCAPTVLHGKPSVKIPAFSSFIREMSSFHSPVWNLPVIDVPDEPLEAPGSPPSADAIIHASPVVVGSPSPVDLVPPSPPSEVQQPEPAVVGAWPASRPESPRRSSLEMETEESEASLAPKPPPCEPEPVPPQPPSRIEASYSRALAELTKYVNSQPLYMQAGGPFGSSTGSLIGLGPVQPLPPPPPPPPPPPHNMHHTFHPLHKVVTERVSAEVKASFKSVEDRITALQETFGDLKSRQTVTEEDVVDLQSHIETLEPESERLLCRIIGAERNIATLSTLQGQMAALQNQVSTLRARMDAPESRSAESPMDDVKACADAFNGLVTEMKALREDVEKRIEAKMETIQGARTEALNALKKVVTEVESIKSSKRKRGDDEVEEETFELSVEEVPVPQVPVPQPPLSVPDVPAIPTCISLPVCVPEVLSPEVSVRPKKRARTGVYTVAQTAAVMAISAAATWSALAFS